MHSPIQQPESPYEQLRRAQNIVSVGTVAEVRHADARCRVRVGDNLSAWLPWLAVRAGGSAAMWWPPQVGEQVAILAPGGDLAQGFALPGAYSDAMPSPGADGKTMVLQWAENCRMVFTTDSKTGATLLFSILNAEFSITDGAISASVPGATMVLDQNGLHVTPEVNVEDIKLTQHKHSGVAHGGSNTEGPVP